MVEIMSERAEEGCKNLKLAQPVTKPKPCQEQVSRDCDIGPMHTVVVRVITI
jgi:hypothetical protein